MWNIIYIVCTNTHEKDLGYEYSLKYKIILKAALTLILQHPQNKRSGKKRIKHIAVCINNYDIASSGYKSFNKNLISCKYHLLTNMFRHNNYYI